MKKILFFMLILFVAVSIFSTDLVVEYIDGYLDLKDGSYWIELYMGDIVRDTDIIKLDENSTAVLSAVGIKITIARPREYYVGDLITTSSSRMSLIGSIGSRISSIVKEEESAVQTNAGGVRASNAQEDFNKIGWAVETSEDLLKDGIAVFEMEDFEYAIILFEDAIYLAEEEESMEILQYAYLLTALCWLQVDDIEYASEYFKLTIELDNSTENAAIAIDLLNSLSGE